MRHGLQAVAFAIVGCIFVSLPATAELPKYQMLDLGTLGGDSSRGIAINSAGQVTGSAQLADGSYHAFLARPGKPMLDLGTLGGPDSYGIDINDAGQVTGYSGTPGGAYRAFRVRAGRQMVDLGTLGGTSSGASAINATGQVTGSSTLADGYSHAFRASPGKRMVDLGTLGGNSHGRAINSAGQVTGHAYLAGGALHAFLASPGQPMLDLDSLGGDFSYGTDINDAGQVTGQAALADADCSVGVAGCYHAFLASSEQPMVGLGSLGLSESRGLALNDAGLVTGDSVRRAFLAGMDQQMLDLAPLSSFSQGHAINKAGQVTGFMVHANVLQVAFVASKESPAIDLGTLPGSYGSSGEDINDAGQVTGTAYAADGNRAFLATPISKLFNDLLSDPIVLGPNDLKAAIKLAQTYYDADDLSPTCSQLEYFNSQVQTLPRTMASRAQKNDLIGQSRAIMDAVGCL